MTTSPGNDACTPTRCQAGGWRAIHLHRLFHITEPPSSKAMAIVALLLDMGATAAHPLVTTRTELSSAADISRRELPATLDRLQEDGWVVVVRRTGTGTSVHLSEAAIRWFTHPTRSGQTHQHASTPDNTVDRTDLVTTTRENADETGLAADMADAALTDPSEAGTDTTDLVTTTRDNADTTESVTTDTTDLVTTTRENADETGLAADMADAALTDPSEAGTDTTDLVTTTRDNADTTESVTTDRTDLVTTTRENADETGLATTGLSGAGADRTESVATTRENADKDKVNIKVKRSNSNSEAGAETTAPAPADPQAGDETPTTDAPGKAASHGGAAADLATGLAGVINAAHPAAAESAGKLAGLWRSRGVDVEAAIEHARGAGHEDPVAHLVELAAAAPWMSWTRPGAGTAKWLTDVVPGLLDGEMALARAQSRQQALPEPRERYAAYLADALARVQRGENPSVAREVLTYELTPDIRSEALAAFDAAVPTVEVIPQPPPAAEFEPVCEPTSYDDRFEDPEFSPDVDLDRYDEPGADEAEPVWEPDSGDDCFEDSEPSPDLDLSRYDEPGGRSTPDRGTQGLPRRQSTIPSVRRRETGKQRLERAVSEYKRLHPAPPKPQPPGRPPPPISRSTPAGKLRARRAAAAAAAAENQGDHPPMGSGRYNAPHGAHSPESGYRTSHVDGDEDQCSASPLSVPVATDDEDGEAW